MKRTHRTRAGLVALLLLTAGAALAGPGEATASALPAGNGTALDPALAAGGSGEVRVVVRVRSGAGSGPQQEVLRLGGRVTAQLPLIDGFAATLPRNSVHRLAETAGVAVVSADRPVRVQGGTASSTGTTLAPRVVQAPGAWAAGATGSGVTVALLDTGVADVPDLAGRVVPVRDDTTGKTASCYDLTGEGTCRDSYGHGTFMAGLIAGDGLASGGQRTGAAPAARVVSVKVAGADGAADVSTVLAGLQWIVSFRDRYNIRVLNLSLGTDSQQSWKDDPLNYAVERAWDAGIFVVVAAANNGPGPGTIAKPADDPWVLTVGAVDDKGTVGIGDDRAPDFSSRGPTREGVAKPDVVAPGAHVLSLRSPRSRLDSLFPPKDTSSRYRSGSGTSMAAALVSGVAATALQAHPELSPNQLKHALRASARPVASPDSSVVGAGLVDAAAVVKAPAAGAANAGLGHSSGRGSLDASRGSLEMHVDDPLQTAMTGRQTAQLLLWDPVAFTTGSWTASAWYTSVQATAGWNTAVWNTDGFDGHNWTGHNWTGHNWTGSSWYGERDEGSSYGRSGSGSGSYGAWD